MFSFNAFVRSLCIFGAAIGLCAAANADWPDRPLRIVVPFSPGVGGDIMIRSMSEELTKILGQPIVVDNRDGAAGNIGTKAVSAAASDGYTFLIAQTGNFVINQHLYRSFGIDPVKAFDPVIHIGNSPAVLFTNTTVPANNFQEFVAYARANKGKLNFGTPGVGSVAYMTLETINRRLALDLISIAYRGTAPVLLGLISNDLQLGFGLAGPFLPQVKAGKIKPLAVASDKRLNLMPDVPTFKELGMADVGGETWWALVAPAGTSTAILDRVNTAVREALALPAVKKRLEEQGISIVGSSRKEMVSKMNSEAARWATKIKDLNVPSAD